MTDLSADDLRKRLGNIDQIRDLLFGVQLAEYDQRFKQYAQQIEHLDAQLVELKAETSRNLSQLKAELSTEIQQGFNRLDRQFHQVQTAQIEHRSSSQSFERQYAQELDSTHRSISDHAQFLKNDLSQTRQQFQEDLTALSERLTQSMGTEIANLQQIKLSQSGLADILFELCLKLKTESGEGSKINEDVQHAESL